MKVKEYRKIIEGTLLGATLEDMKEEDDIDESNIIGDLEILKFSIMSAKLKIKEKE